MVAITKGMTDDDMKAAADYFAQIKPRPGYVKVIEAAIISPAKEAEKVYSPATAALEEPSIRKAV